MRLDRDDDERAAWGADYDADWESESRAFDDEIARAAEGNWEELGIDSPDDWEPMSVEDVMRDG